MLICCTICSYCSPSISVNGWSIQCHQHLHFWKASYKARERERTDFIYRLCDCKNAGRCSRAACIPDVILHVSLLIRNGGNKALRFDVSAGFWNVKQADIDRCYTRQMRFPFVRASEHRHKQSISEINNNTFQRICSELAIFKFCCPTHTYWSMLVVHSIVLLLFHAFLCRRIAWWLMGLNDDFLRFLVAIGIVLLVSNAAMSSGYFASAVAPHVSVGD